MYTHDVYMIVMPVIPPLIAVWGFRVMHVSVVTVVLQVHTMCGTVWKPILISAFRQTPQRVILAGEF